MSNQIHGHEVMQMMLESTTPFTRDTLRDAITQRFGTDARFYTCSAENMSPDQLIDFLEARGKFIQSETGFNTAPDKICNH